MKSHFVLNRRKRQTLLKQNEVEQMMAEFPFSHSDKSVCVHTVHANLNTAMSMHTAITSKA